MIKKLFNKLQNNVKDMINMCKGLPLIVVILIILAIVILPDPIVILGLSVMKKIKVIVG